MPKPPTPRAAAVNVLTFLSAHPRSTWGEIQESGLPLPPAFRPLLSEMKRKGLITREGRGEGALYSAVPLAARLEALAAYAKN